MDINQRATPQPTSSSISPTGNIDNNTFTRIKLLAILIPFICVILGATLGLVIYLHMRRRRSRRGGSQRPATGPAGTEEGLNELGEAPPPYELDDASKDNIIVEEVEASPAADAGSSGGMPGTPTEPPPAYWRNGSA